MNSGRTWERIGRLQASCLQMVVEAKRTPDELAVHLQKFVDMPSIEGTRNLRGVFGMTVDYDARPEHLLEQGRYDRRNLSREDDETMGFFCQPHPALPTGKQTVRFVLYRQPFLAWLWGMVSNILNGSYGPGGRTIIANMQRCGLRPAFPIELLHVGMRFPGLQLRHRIVALGGPRSMHWFGNGMDDMVLFLGSEQKSAQRLRTISIEEMDNTQSNGIWGWLPGTWFLAVVQSPPTTD